jgi:predicted glycoside hydrolase/deacetylase ChbG (UPF0249 family)
MMARVPAEGLLGGPARSKVVFHADDFGLTPGVNDGILEAYERGVLRSTSLMVTAPAWEDAVARARVAKGLDVGVHLTLVEECPALPPARIPSLVHDGRFWPTHGAVGLRYLQRRWRPEEARRELAAQLDRFAATGLVPSHLDGHQHLHLLPGVFEWVVSEARRRGIRFVRTTLADPLPVTGGLRGLTLVALKGVGWLAARRAVASDLRHLVRFVTVGFLEAGGKLATPRLLAILDRVRRRWPGGIVEVMLHPGSADPTTIRVDANSGYQRANDLALLCDPSLAGALADRDIALTSFRELAVAARA